jgi:pimeloyl-ACP methyl ester carboxylesterase
MVELVRDVALSTAKDTFCAAIQAIVNYDGTDNLKKVQVPTLLLAGQYDKVGRPDGMARIKSQYIAHADYVCLPDAGHYAFAEQHELFNENFLNFVRQKVWCV